jgi:hypothetical protein
LVKLRNKEKLRLTLYVKLPDFFNRGFCQITTESKLITLWSDQPFQKIGSLLTQDREWLGDFNIQIINGSVTECSRKFSMKNISVNPNELDDNLNSLLNTYFDQFIIEDLISVKVGVDLAPEDINIQIPLIYHKTQSSDLPCNPDYEELADLYLSKGIAPLQSAIGDWLQKNSLIDQDPSDNLSYFNQISMTVFDIASKKSNTLASRDLKKATFTIKIPFELQDYYSYQPVQSQIELAKEAMALINTGFFDKAITELINLTLPR